jgi:subtilisin family serine protease
VEGLDYAISKRPQVINLSLGSRWNDATVAGLAREAVRRGIVVVAAAGNGGATGPPIYPAALEEVIAVTAVDARDELFDGATRGVYVDLAAPGVEVLTTRPGNDYRAATGTSFASPYVAGTLALLCARRPGSTPAQLQSLLEHTVEDLGAKGKDPLFGSGRLDACRAAGVCGSK